MTLVLQIGSRARGDGDATSDRDAILVSDCHLTRRFEAARLASSGYGVTTFSRDRFRALAGSGSLFLRHAIDEGKLIRGSADCWSGLSAGWRQGSHYIREVEENLQFLRILSCVPSTLEGRLAAVDVIVCSVRNVLVRAWAMRGVYIFSWAELIRHHMREGGVSQTFADAVAWARMVKNQRRRGIRVPCSDVELADLCWAVRSVLGNIKYRRIRRGALLEREISLFRDHSYGQLRACELLVSAYSNDSAMVKLKLFTEAPAYFLCAKPSFSS